MTTKINTQGNKKIYYKLYTYCVISFLNRVQLLKVLETRKQVLRKEQGMAFARAVAAGFDVDHMAPLVSFAECFGASRLK